MNTVIKYFWESEEDFGEFSSTSDQEALKLAQSRAAPDRLLLLEAEVYNEEGYPKSENRRVFPTK